MKFKIFIAVAVLAVGSLFVYNASNSSKTSDAEVLSYSTIESSISTGQATVYDVRTAEEYAESHIEGAVNHDLQDIQAEKYPDIDKDSEIYVYCRSGNRSSQAKALLEKAGYTNVTDLGGLSDVQAIGGELQ